jgi:hypothetical protein
MGPLRSSKKRPQTNRAERGVKEISSAVTPQSGVLLRGNRSGLSSADYVTFLFGFPSSDQPHDYSNNDQHRDGDPNIQRRK